MQTMADLRGFMPAATIMAAVIATGVPKPARASSRAPKQKAMRIDKMRRSSVMPRRRSRRTLSQPSFTVRLYIQTAGIRIHIIWQIPKKIPSRVADAAKFQGICHTSVASRIDTIKVAKDAFHAAILKTPRARKSTTNGNAATSAERARFSPTGERIWWNSRGINTALSPR